MAIDITILIPVYNGKRYLRLAVESALSARQKNGEMLVVDDGSDDGGLDTLADLPVRSLRREPNLGIASAINWGIANAKGKWITILDSDDLLATNGLSSRIEKLRQSPDRVGVAGLPAGVIDDNGKLLRLCRETSGPPNELTLSFFQSGGQFPCLLWLFLLAKSAVEAVGGLDEKLASAFDCDLIFRLLQKSSIPVVPDPVVYRRWHDHNHSHALEAGRRKLSARTQAEVTQIYRRYGIPVGQAQAPFTLWEESWTSVSVTRPSLSTEPTSFRVLQ